MKAPLDVAFVWHMHQPYYRISDSGAFEMPWARMHAFKDYLGMIDVLEAHPGLRQTFNLVPSLVEQLMEYAAGGYVDTYQEHCTRPAADLSRTERSFLLAVICERSSHPRTRNNPRYLELALKRDRCMDGRQVRVEEFSEAELRDIQVWFDLSWAHPTDVREGPLADLVRRGRDFTEEDKATLRAAQAERIGRVLPTYRRAEAGGGIELTTSPYYHPILPLLMNSDLARVSLPGVELPTRRFDHPEDAEEQVRGAVRLHTEVFGSPPAGIWCSEQSVGEDVIPLLSRHGFRWTVSDEGVLARSFGRGLGRDGEGRVNDPAFLYSGYRLEREHGGLDIVFRDRVLSDLVGFTYQDWDPADAAGDLLRRLRQIRLDLPEDGRPHLVTIALDGENAWEYYREQGRDFLARLYEDLEKEPALRCVTVSEHLRDGPARSPIPWLHTGSWINGDLGTWVGDRAHRPAWDRLHDARDAVAEARADRDRGAPTGSGGGTPSLPSAGAGAPQADMGSAWREILIAEGSDWFWWFSDHQESGLDDIWDAAFRRHLQQAYRYAGLVPPAALFAPILERDFTTDKGRVTPSVDGRMTHPHEWDRGVRLRGAGAGVMQRSTTVPIDDLRFGWSEASLYFLIAPRLPLSEAGVEVTFHMGPADQTSASAEEAASGTLGFTASHHVSLRLLAGEEGVSVEPPTRDDLTIDAGTLVEAALSWEALGVARGDGLLVGATVSSEGVLLESYPSTGIVARRP